MQRDSSLGDHSPGTKHLTFIWRSAGLSDDVCTHAHRHSHVTLRRPNGKLGCPEALSALFFETRSFVDLGLADLTMLAAPGTPGIFLVSASPEWANRAIMLGVLAGFFIIIQQAIRHQSKLPRPQLVLLEGQHSGRLGLQRNDRKSSQALVF